MMNEEVTKIAAEAATEATETALTEGAKAGSSVSVKNATTMTVLAFIAGVVITGGILAVIYFLKKHKANKKRKAVAEATARDENGDIPVIVEEPENN